MPDTLRAYRQHLDTCPACRDDAADPVGATLVQATRQSVLPPPDFTARLLQRLPAESPRELALADARRRRFRRRLTVTGAVALPLAAIALGTLTAPLWAGTTLGLSAEIIRTVVASALGPLIVMLASAAVVALLLQTVLRQPTARPALASAALALLLLVSAGAVTQLNDSRSLGAGAQPGATIATLFQPINVEGARAGTVASLAGDIQAGGQIAGSVASLLGRVELAAGTTVAGDVLAGAGQSGVEQAMVAGTVRESPGALVTAAAGFGQSTASAPTAARVLTVLLAALVTLALAGLVILLWPQWTLRISALLPAQPWAALGIGLLVTALLMLLALPLLALLAATVVGLILVPLLLLVAHLPYVQGLAAVGQALGQRLTGRATLGSSLWGVAAQLVLVLGLTFVSPLVGLAAFYALASLGLGAQLIARQGLG